jgi:hypothetical protein
MDVTAERMNHLDHIIDVVLEIETALRHRHHAGVGPVGDVDFMTRQKRFNGAAQQRRIMPGHRRDDQHARLRRAQRLGELALEVQQAAKRLFPNGLDLDGNAHAVDFGIVQTPFRLAVTARHAFEQFATRSDRFAELGVGPRIERVLEHELRHVGQSPCRIERGLPHLVHPVHRCGQRRADL